MSTLLEKALEKVVALPDDEQDAIASQILASLADEDAWKTRSGSHEKRPLNLVLDRQSLRVRPSGMIVGDLRRGREITPRHRQAPAVANTTKPRYCRTCSVSKNWVARSRRFAGGRVTPDSSPAFPTRSERVQIVAQGHCSETQERIPKARHNRPQGPVQGPDKGDHAHRHR